MVTIIYPNGGKIQIKSGKSYSYGSEDIDIYDGFNNLIANVCKMPGLLITTQERDEDDD